MTGIGTETRVRGGRARPRARGDRPQRHPPRDRRAGLRHAGQHPRGGEAGARRGLDALRPAPRPARAARGDRRGRHERARASTATARPGRRRPGRQADHVLRDPRPGPGGRRGHLPGPRLPDLRVDDPLRRRDAGPVRDHARRTTSASTSTSSSGLVNDAHPADHHQLAREPDRRRPHPRGHRADRGPRRCATRTSRSSPTRSTGGSSTTASTSRSPRCPAWRSGRSSSTGSPRPTR